MCLIERCVRTMTVYMSWACMSGQELLRMTPVDHAHEGRMDAVADQLLEPRRQGPGAVDTDRHHEVLLLTGPRGRVLDRDAEAVTVRAVGATGVHERAVIHEHRPGRH